MNPDILRLADNNIPEERGLPYMDLCLSLLYGVAEKDTDEGWKTVDETIIPEIVGLELSNSDKENLHHCLGNTMYNRNKHKRDATISVYESIEIPPEYINRVVDTMVIIAKGDSWKYNRCRAVTVLGREDIKDYLEKTDGTEGELITKIRNTLQYVVQNDNYGRARKNAKESIQKYKTNAITEIG